MTQNKQFKKRVRARMAKTGESYVVARQALLGDAPQKTTKLRALGFWKSVQESKWPDPVDLVDASWDAQERQQVIEHLRSGKMLKQHKGSSWCRLGCNPDPSVLSNRPKTFFQGSGTSSNKLTWEERRAARYVASEKSKDANLSSRQPHLDMGSADLTDGFYVWPEGLAHYLEKHNVRLPVEFVDHVLLWPEELAMEAPSSYKVDESWWLRETNLRRLMAEPSILEQPYLIQIESPFLPGWYYHDVEYPEDGSNGPYVTIEEAQQAAKLADYELEDVAFWEQKDMSRVFNRHMLKQIEDQVGEVAQVFEGAENSVNVRKNLAEKLSLLLSELLDKMKREGVRTPPDDGIEIVWPEMTEADRKNRLLRYEIKINEPHRYSQFVDALVSEGLLPQQSVVGLGLVEEAN